MDDSHQPSNPRDDDASAQLLSALLDGELSGDEQREMLERLQSDPEEAERFAHYRAQRHALKALFPLPGAAPALFVQRRAPRWRAFAYACAGLAAGLLIGGALGNVVDRVLYGAVADFLNMSLPGWQNPYSFNVADISIFAGALGLVLMPQPKTTETPAPAKPRTQRTAPKPPARP
ncbi:signal peptidase II, partial [Bradyrhizobium sp.]|uniref:signal peptidase II n=1 Tax=Bradyrhizobium sp. TaxID=376 RepID=UPI0025C1DCE9